MCNIVGRGLFLPPACCPKKQALKCSRDKYVLLFIEFIRSIPDMGKVNRAPEKHVSLTCRSLDNSTIGVYAVHLKMQRFVPPLPTDTVHRPQLAQLLRPFRAHSDAGLVSPAAAIAAAAPVRRG